MNQTDIERALLARLYEPFFRERSSLNLGTLCDELGADKTLFWNAVNEMSYKGLIRAIQSYQSLLHPNFKKNAVCARFQYSKSH